MAGSAAPAAPINVTGTGSEDVPISIAAGTPYLATIINTGQGPFTVWTLGAGGAQNEQLVNVTGPFAGTRLFDEEGHSTGFSVASDGSWSIEVNPVSAARSWDLSERLAGDGADVVAVFPPTSADTDTTVRYDGGALVISAHTAAGAVELLRDTGPLEEELVLPSGTSLIEVEADAAWSIAPSERCRAGCAALSGGGGRWCGHHERDDECRCGGEQVTDVMNLRGSRLDSMGPRAGRRRPPPRDRGPDLPSRGLTRNARSHGD